MSALPFASPGGVDLPCVIEHDAETQHTLFIAGDEENDVREENVTLTIVAHGQPMGDITINRAALIAALGGRLP